MAATSMSSPVLYPTKIGIVVGYQYFPRNFQRATERSSTSRDLCLGIPRPFTCARWIDSWRIYIRPGGKEENERMI
jgi:hypothetical protein